MTSPKGTTAEPMRADENDTQVLLQRAAGGDREALDRLFALHRGRLLRMVRFRMDHRLLDRVDASDVVQDAHVEALQRFPQYLRDPSMPFFQWLRFLTGQKVLQLHRRHLGSLKRDVRVEVRPSPLPEVSSETLAHHLAASVTAPSTAAARLEQHRILLESLEAMDRLDREVLVLRHFEQLSNAEVAAELGLQEAAASKRYVRALVKLQRAMSPPPE